MAVSPMMKFSAWKNSHLNIPQGWVHKAFYQRGMDVDSASNPHPIPAPITPVFSLPFFRMEIPRRQFSNVVFKTAARKTKNSPVNYGRGNHVKKKCIWQPRHRLANGANPRQKNVMRPRVFACFPSVGDLVWNLPTRLPYCEQTPRLGAHSGLLVRNGRGFHTDFISHSAPITA